MADYLEASWQKLADQIANRSSSFQANHPGGSSFLPENMRGQTFRASNALTLAAEGQAKGYDDPRWVTRTESERMGGGIRAREVGTPVQYWNMTDGKPEVITAVVFNASQSFGLPAYERQTAPIEDRAKAVDAIVSGSHAVVQRANSDLGYNSQSDVIRVANRIAGDNPASQQQEVIQRIAEWTNHPSRLSRSYDPTDATSLAREQLRTTIGAMMVSDRMKIGFTGESDPIFARRTAVLIRDRNELGRAAIAGEMIAREVMSFSTVRSPELSQAQMQTLARSTLNESARERAWAAAAPSQSTDTQRQRQAAVSNQLSMRA